MSDNMTHEFPRTAQGEAKKASPSDMKIESTGYTNPNLHRRIESDPELSESDIADGIIAKSYSVHVSNLNSYRTIELSVHDEESEIDEIP